MTQRIDKVKMDKVRGPNSKLVTNGPEAQNESKHSSLDKMGRLQKLLNYCISSIKLNFHELTLVFSRTKTTLENLT